MMKKAIISILIVGIIVPLFCSAAFAMRITTLAQYFSTAGFDIDIDSATSGTATSSLSATGINNGAAGNDAGDLAAAAGVYLDDSGSIFGNYTYGVVSWSETYTVAEDGNYALNFDIMDGRLAVMDNTGLFGMRASYTIGIYVNDTSEWESSATISDRRSGLQFRQSGEELNSTYFEDNGGQVMGYEFAPYSNSLDLGFLSAGTTFDISMVVTVTASAPGWGTGAEVYFGNPLDLSKPGITGELVPLPATFILFGLGVISLLSLRRLQFSRR